MSLHGQMTEFLVAHPDDDNVTLAETFLATVAPDPLTALIAEEFGRIRRAEARMIEVEEISAQTRAPGEWSDRLRQNLVALGRSQMTSFGQMTVEQHRIRLAMLVKQREGLDRTIRLHEEAIRDIEAAGVRCLDEIGSRRRRKAG